MIKSSIEMIKTVWENYEKDDNELNSFYFDFDVEMKKSDILEAYAELQYEINGDEVVRVENGVKMEDLIPDDRAYDEIYSGNLREFLESFIGSKEFIRLNDDEVLDFIF